MIGLYFSGTGNSKYCVETFVKECDALACSFSIEDESAILQIEQEQEIVFGYPVQWSSLPKMLHDFVDKNRELWKGKKIFVIATMGLFSGDGAGVLARLLKKYGAEIIGGLHVKMPDSICDEKVLKKSFEANRKLLENANQKLKKAAMDWKNGKQAREGLEIFPRLAGFFGQRLYFSWKTKRYSDKLKIDIEKCVGCKKCVRQCPMGNITFENNVAVAGTQCTLCYRCVNQCPKQAITLLGKRVVEQHDIQKYLKNI